MISLITQDWEIAITLALNLIGIAINELPKGIKCQITSKLITRQSEQDLSILTGLKN